MYTGGLFRSIPKFLTHILLIYSLMLARGRYKTVSSEFERTESIEKGLFLLISHKANRKQLKLQISWKKQLTTLYRIVYTNHHSLRKIIETFKCIFHIQTNSFIIIITHTVLHMGNVEVGCLKFCLLSCIANKKMAYADDNSLMSIFQLGTQQLTV